jgi:hypothetical protein
LVQLRPQTFPALVLTALVFVEACPAARCLTTPDPRIMGEYESYLKKVDEGRLDRFVDGELWWAPESVRAQMENELRAGKAVRRKVNDGTINERIADWNGTIIDWIGAVQINAASLDDLKAVLQDYGRYSNIYNPLIYECRAQAIPAGAGYNIALGLQYVFRLGSLFPQRYSFQVKAHSDYSERSSRGGPVLLSHWRAEEIRESDSGIPGRNDLLEVRQDRGILWALNTYWRARQMGPNLYVEFESITLARSVERFKCKIGILPIPKSVVANIMDLLPAQSLDLMLTATKAECEHRSAKR